MAYQLPDILTKEGISTAVLCLLPTTFSDLVFRMRRRAEQIGMSEAEVQRRLDYAVKFINRINTQLHERINLYLVNDLLDDLPRKADNLVRVLGLVEE